MDNQKQPFNPLLALLAGLAALFFVFPLIGLIAGAPWGNMISVITSKTALDALGLSIVASLSSTVIALAFGFPLAWLLARGRFRGKGLVRGLTTLPMVLPPVVGGIALLLAYGRRGFIGEPLDKATGISLPFTLAGVIVAESFVAMPFFVITVESGLRSVNRRLEDAARSLGAGRLMVFRRVTLAAHLALARRRHGADLGAGTGRVRGHDHLRRQPAGAHPDHAAGDLHQPELGQDG
jgi:molybdate transport system permease protein